MVRSNSTRSCMIDTVMVSWKSMLSLFAPRLAVGDRKYPYIKEDISAGRDSVTFLSVHNLNTDLESNKNGTETQLCSFKFRFFPPHHTTPHNTVEAQKAIFCICILIIKF